MEKIYELPLEAFEALETRISKETLKNSFVARLSSEILQ